MDKVERTEKRFCRKNNFHCKTNRSSVSISLGRPSTGSKRVLKHARPRRCRRNRAIFIVSHRRSEIPQGERFRFSEHGEWEKRTRASDRFISIRGMFRSRADVFTAVLTRVLFQLTRLRHVRDVISRVRRRRTRPEYYDDVAVIM